MIMSDSLLMIIYVHEVYVDVLSCDHVIIKHIIMVVGVYEIMYNTQCRISSSLQTFMAGF